MKSPGFNRPKLLPFVLSYPSTPHHQKTRTFQAMALVVPQYVYNASTPGAPTVSALSIKHIPAQNLDNGLRLSIGNVAASPAWPVAPTAQVVAGGPHDFGLYTLSQMQCVCIAVAIYPTPATPNWTQAWLAHVS